MKTAIVLCFLGVCCTLAHAAESESCVKKTVGSYGKSRIQNSNFIFPFQQLPTGTKSFTVSIEGSNDAYLLLSPSTDIADDGSGSGTPKIVLGGWENQKSALLCRSSGDWKSFPSPGVLSESQSREFFVEIDGNNLKVGRVGQTPFIDTTVDCPVDVKYVGVASGWSSTAVVFEFCPGICGIPAEEGFCNAYIPRYFYNVASGQCDAFLYGGCEGNQNNFVTKDECERVCLGCEDDDFACSTEIPYAGYIGQTLRDLCYDPDWAISARMYCPVSCGICTHGKRDLKSLQDKRDDDLKTLLMTLRELLDQK